MTNKKPQIKIVDCQTGEEIVRDATVDEIAQINASELEASNLKAETDAKAEARQTIANRLGLTADELQVLLG